MDGKTVTIDLREVPCGIHDGKMLAECGCPLDNFSHEWMWDGIHKAAAEVGRKLRIEHEQRILEAVFGTAPAAAALEE